MFFASDNTSGVAPQILAAVTRANEGYARSYGADEIMGRVRARIREVFEAPEAEVHLVATGTAANALSLALITPPWAAVFAHEAAHIAVDECGAPEFYTAGAKLIPVPGAHGKITPDTLAKALAQVGASGVHGVQRGCLSLTNVTEAGTVYTPAEIAALTALAPDPASFRCGRDFSAWLGLTPLQRSTGGKQKLGQITKMGERTLRRLLVIGASAVIKQALIKGAPQGSWLAQMLARKPRMLVAVALANKTGRIVWALLAKGGVYQAPAVAAA